MTRMPSTNEDNPDFKLCAAVVIAVKGITLERKRYRVIALNSFDAAQLNEFEPIIVSGRWREAVG
jgi:hypothetical protein